MATVFVRHPVADFAAWKRVYDEISALRVQHGIQSASVHRDASDPDTVVVVHKFPSTTAAMAFMGDAGLKAGMQRAGVTAAPVVWITEDVEATSK